MDSSPTTWTFRLHDISPPITLLVEGSGWFVCLLLGCMIGVKTEMRVLTEKPYGFVHG